MRDREVLRLGTRGSRLALWQTDHVIARLERAWPSLRGERVTFSTLGDRVTDRPLPRVGDRGLFTRDIEEGLRDGTIDAAVHSLKDLPTESAAGLVVAAVLERADPREVLVSRSAAPLHLLPSGARIGTSSARRRAQVLARRPDLAICDIRGNVPTRVEKVQRGEYDATMLALAGLQRLDLAHVADEIFAADEFLPAPGQGALAVQVRADDILTRARVEALDHTPSRLATICEREVLSALEGGCQAPLGTCTRWLDGATLQLTAVVASDDGRTLIRSTAVAPVEHDDAARALAGRAADDLRARGAMAVLEACRRNLQASHPIPAGGDRL